MKKITMKTIIDNSNIPAALVRSVVKQSDGWASFIEMAGDVSRHGADSGFSGWIYYTETCKFARRNKKDIMAMAKDQAAEFGQGTLEMISGFNCIESLEISTDEIAETIYTGKGEMSDQIFNCLAWFALEEVCRAYCDLFEDD